jgi:hypothetical protein
MKNVLIIFALLMISTSSFAEFPSVQEIQRRALHVAGLDVLTINRWQKNVRWKAAVPQLRFSIQRDLDEQLRISNKDNISITGGNVVIGPDEQDLVRDYDAGTRFQIAATWYLDELVFNRDEIIVSQERRRFHEEKYALLKEINRLYFERTAALYHLQMKKRLPDLDRAEISNRIASIEAELDGLTDGWILSQIQRGGQ